MRILTLILILLWLTQPVAETLTPDQIPSPLKPWMEWVLQKHPEHNCPVSYHEDIRNCLWPGELLLEADQQGGRFSQHLTVYRESQVFLPGDRFHWPMDVQINGEPAVVTELGQAPVVLLQPGVYRVEGRFLWSRLPAAIRINPLTGIIRYQLDGKKIRHPEIRDGRLWLQAGQQRETPQTPEDRLHLEIYRLLADGHPFQVTTHMRIEVSGSQREVLLGLPLLEDFIPLRIDSMLPARLEPDNRLRVQIRPGRWELRLVARHPGNLTRLKMPTQPPPWPEQEIWVYRAAHQDRLTEVRGVTQIDPRQVRLPADWSNLPAYRVSPETGFSLEVVRRGDPEPEPDRLTLQRDLWLDFSGEGYTLRDRIGGRMTRDWRISLDPELSLGRVTIDEKPQFVTRLLDGSREGVEVRRGQLNLTAEFRQEGDISRLPAIGWGRDFQEVGATLHLPPGWRLLAVSGVDNVPSSWLQQWTLYDLFLVLITTVAVARLWGWVWAPLALVTLVLTWHAPNAPQMIWLYLIAAIALLRVLPNDGLLYRMIRNARLIGLLVLLVVTMPFMVQQVREGIYPQLERPWITPANLESQQQVAGSAVSPKPAKSQFAERDEVMLKERKRVHPELKDLLPPSYSSYKALNEIDPAANIQTGPGLPGWQWRQARLLWNGPVASGQQIGLYLLGPRTHLLLNLLMVFLVLAFAWRCLDIRGKSGSGHSWHHLLLAPLVILPLVGVPVDSQAQGFPPQSLLEELEKRLLEIDTPSPRASIDQLSILLDHDSYQASIALQATQETAIPLPLDTGQITPVKVLLDQQDAGNRLYRTKENQLWLLLPPGHHKLELKAWLPPVGQIQIPLPLRPHRVELSGQEGWAVEGIRPDGVPEQQLSLTRIRQEQPADSRELTPTALPPFLSVERTLRLGVNWEVETRVRRLSPAGTSLSLQIPVVPGASVVTEGFRVKAGEVLVNMAANQRELSWRSRLDPIKTLTLTAPESSDWLETWQADIGPIWHVRIEGIPPIHHQDAANRWLPTWHPWPGEQITLHTSRPAGVVGNTLTIDSSKLEIKLGKRATDSTLTFRLRSSQGGQHDLGLPEGVQLLAVKIDGRTQPIRQDDRLLSMPVVPGVQAFEVQWREMAGSRTFWRMPSISLGAPSVNARLTLHVPEDRWTLWSSGPDLGPAVLFWGVLLVLALAAFILSRISSSYLPLGFVSWLLLGIGLSQIAVTSALLVIVWFFLLHYRSGIDASDIPEWQFNLIQAVIAILTFGFLLILFRAVQQGLLGLPVMQIRGYGSEAYLLNWYQDRVSDAHPQVTLLSVPLMVYRLLMLAWALWLAFSLLKWLKWGWLGFSKGGLWRTIELKVPELSKGWKKSADNREDQSQGESG
ncbi:MAG: oligosaccharide repeat unit polymerase [Gammaproteobacteria bacterium]|nr:oligosaccharide repeat unit polymerase [Gammaproteobacteria bacterium]